jgi:MFS family permease
MDAITVGIMTSVLLITQTVANPLLGWLADRWSRKWILAIGSICAVLSALLAYLIKDPGWFASVFILTGFANVAYWTVGMAIALEFGNENEKPVYVGMSNTLIAPATILAPILGGLLADLMGYETTFIISAIFAVITFLIVAIIVKDKKVQSVSQ